ncbi:MAG: hypothetical protein E3J21_15070 [Anaerolineales bacterium]|nr:MAG: hypothetical protein E3J21_15070 [Anaerolineales bacterium]
MKTTIGHLSIVDGVAREGAENVLAIEPSPLIPLGRGKGNLYAIVEVAGEGMGRDELCQLLLETINKEYFRAPGGITAGLRQAIKAANAQLFRENRDRPIAERLIGGVSCVALRENDAYIGQAGPALVYAAHKGELARYPETSPWLDLPPLQWVDEGYVVPLGIRRDVDIDLFHCRVQPGDTIVLAETALAQIAGQDRIAKAVVYQEVDIALAYLKRLAGGRDCSALVIEILAVAEEAEAEILEEEGAPFVKVESFAEQVRPGRERQPAGPSALERVTTLGENLMSRLDLAGLLQGLGGGLMAGLAILGSGVTTLFRRILPGAETPEQVPARRVAQARRPRAAAEAKGNKVMIALAIAIPLIVALLVGVVYLQWGKAREARFTELVEQAETKHALALNASDKPTARGLLHEAQVLLTEAHTLEPEDPKVDKLHEKIQDTLDEINNVVPLYWIGALQKYDDPGSDPGRVTLSGIDIYVLDKGTDRVYKYLLNEVGDGLQDLDVDPVLLRKGDQRGDIVVSDLVDMVWMSVGSGRQTSNLLVLESGGSLLEYDPVFGLAVLPVGDKDKWRYPQLIGSYFGNFYLLDSQSNQIFKYLPTADGGYSNPPELWFQIDVDLTGVVDMAIDGYIYLLYADGRILKFMGGELEPFELTELDEPLRGPTAIFTGPDEETKFLYVADAGNRRIVQFSKEGQFIRQFRAAEPGVFDQLKNLHVDEIGSKLYVLSGNTLYMANIPEGEGASEPGGQ